ncbi:MAG: hypothetical protein GY874_15710 [Desulfobacteraceae bacterium]|nr:hypothetical protein [Desulfobacteraceae bacterium]
MNTKEKKIAAALAAVAAYIQQEQEVCAQAPVTAMQDGPGAANLNLWGLSGRQSMMQMRNLMQLKAFDRFR